MSTGISILGSQVLFGLHPAATHPAATHRSSMLQFLRRESSSPVQGTVIVLPRWNQDPQRPRWYSCLPQLSECLGEPRTGRSSISVEVVPPRFPGSPSHGRSVTPRQPRTSFFGGKGGSRDGENINGILG